MCTTNQSHFNSSASNRIWNRGILLNVEKEKKTEYS